MWFILARTGSTHEMSSPIKSYNEAHEELDKLMLGGSFEAEVVSRNELAKIFYKYKDLEKYKELTK